MDNFAVQHSVSGGVCVPWTMSKTDVIICMKLACLTEDPHPSRIFIVVWILHGVPLAVHKMVRAANAKQPPIAPMVDSV